MKDPEVRDFAYMESSVGPLKLRKVSFLLVGKRRGIADHVKCDPARDLVCIDAGDIPRNT